MTNRTKLILGAATVVLLLCAWAAGNIYYETLPGLVVKHPVTGVTTLTINGTNGNVNSSGTINGWTVDGSGNPSTTGTVTAPNFNVGTVTFTNPPAPPSFLVAALPAASTGATAWASDMVTPWGVGELVYYDGTSWKGASSKIRAKSTLPESMLELLRVGWVGTTPYVTCRVAAWQPADTVTFPENTGDVKSGTGAKAGGLEYSDIPLGHAVLTGTSTTGFASYSGAVEYFVAGDVAVDSVRGAFKNGLSNDTDKYWFFCGLGLDGGTLNANAVGFVYDPDNTLGLNPSVTNHWQCLTRASSANTVSASGVAASASLQTLTLTYTTTNVVFYINSTAVATNTAHIPSGYIATMTAQIVKTAGGSSRWMAIDNHYFGVRHAVPRTLF